MYKLTVPNGIHQFSENCIKFPEDTGAGGNTVLSNSTDSQLYTGVGPSLPRFHFGVCFGRDDTENDFEIFSHRFVLLLLYIPLRKLTCAMSYFRDVVHFIFLEKVVT
jgi:hypothetical protein